MSSRTRKGMSLEDAKIHPSLADALLKAYECEFAHWSPRSQKLAFQSVRKLVSILEHERIGMRVPLPADTVDRTYEYLLVAQLASATRVRLQRDIHILLRWCQRNVPGVVTRATTFTVPIFKKEVQTEPKKLAPELLKSILTACAADIEVVEARMARGRVLIAGEVTSKADIEISQLLGELLHLGDGELPLQARLLQNPSLYRRFKAAGGHRAFSELLYLTFEGMFPFYLSVLAKTSGNTESIRDLKLTCIEPHPLRKDLEVLRWDKPRAGREQQVDFPVGKAWSAPDLVRRVLHLNEPLRKRCALNDRDKVFLALGLRRQIATVPVLQVLHTMLNDFIARHDLPDFDFEDLRPSGAKVHRVAGHSILAAKKRLNHRHVSSTVLYTNPGDAEDQHYVRIAKFQGQLARGPQRQSAEKQADRESVQQIGARDARTVFGFECGDPFGGLDGKTPKGTRCVNFTQCATCHGSLVPVDDCEIISMILGARDGLKDAKERAMREGWWPRFAALYADTLDIISDEILPAVTPAVLRVAETMVRRHYIPYLD